MQDNCLRESFWSFCLSSRVLSFEEFLKGKTIIFTGFCLRSYVSQGYVVLELCLALRVCQVWTVL
jgi:hypothetical protein